MIIEILTALAAALLFFLSKHNLWQAVVITAALTPTYLIRFSLGFIPTNVFELLVLALVLGSATHSLQWHQAWQRLKLTYKGLIGFFLIAALVSTLISDQLMHSAGILKGWIIIPILFSWVVYVGNSSPAQKRYLLHALIVCATAVSGIALLMGPTHGRLQGIYDTPNSLALFIAPLLAAGVWIMVRATDKKPRWLVVACGIQALALLGSQSLGGVIAILVAITIGMWTWAQKEKRYQGIRIIVAVLFVGLTLFWINGKIPYLLHSFTQPTSATVRVQLWSVGRDLITQHPLRGVGLGQFEPAYQRKLHERFQLDQTKPIPEFVFRDPHNWIISFWLNLGLLGLIVFVFINTLAVTKNWRSQKTITQAYILLLLTYLLFGLVDTIYWKNDLATLWWLVIAVLI
jgi:O-antigen ligase